MKTSLKGILAIINEEALVLSTYRDAAGVLTIGAGHTAMAGGMAPKQGDRITIEQAIALLAADLAKFERRVSTFVKRAMAQHEFDALVSFDFNTGAIAGGTVDDRLARGDIDGAMATLQKYERAAGRKPPASTGGETVKKPCSAVGHIPNAMRSRFMTPGRARYASYRFHRLISRHLQHHPMWRPIPKLLPGHAGCWRL